MVFKSFSIKRNHSSVRNVYKAIFAPVLFSPSLSMGEFKTGRNRFLSFNTNMLGRKNGVKLFVRVEGRKNRGGGGRK